MTGDGRRVRGVREHIAEEERLAINVRRAGEWRGGESVLTKTDDATTQGLPNTPPLLQLGTNIYIYIYIIHGNHHGLAYLSQQRSHPSHWHCLGGNT